SRCWSREGAACAASPVVPGALYAIGAVRGANQPACGLRAGLARTGLATAGHETMKAGGKTIEVVRVRITEAGRKIDRGMNFLCEPNIIASLPLAPRRLSGAAARCIRLPRTLGLNRRTRNRAVRTEHAAIARLRPQRRPAAGAKVEKLTRVGRHKF